MTPTTIFIIEKVYTHLVSYRVFILLF